MKYKNIVKFSLLLLLCLGQNTQAASEGIAATVQGQQISESKLEECGLTFEDFKMRGTENKFYSAMNLMKKKAKL